MTVRLLDAWEGGLTQMTYDTTVHLLNPGDGYWLQFPYDGETVAQLKKSVPGRDRLWDSVEKRWWVAANHHHTLATLFTNFEDLLEEKKKQGRLFD